MLLHLCVAYVHILSTTFQYICQGLDGGTQCYERVWCRFDDCINNYSKSRESCHWHLPYFGYEIFYNVSSKCGFLIPQVRIKLITGAGRSPPKSGDTVNKSWACICLRSIPQFFDDVHISLRKSILFLDQFYRCILWLISEPW